MKIMILPGNGGCLIQTHHWYPWLFAALKAHGFEVIAENMPDPVLARSQYWIPFIEEKLEQDPTAILIGHSSGAVAAMRYAERHPLQGLILVAACHSDLGLESERLSGYYKEPWPWDQIRENTQWILQMASLNDPFIPIEEARYIHNQLHSEYLEFSDRGHFMGHEKGGQRLPEALNFLLKRNQNP
jgi:hypothetical protein